ncbi:hypothetical protein ACXU4B_10605 [Dyella soli]|uniref:Uncharacterized protein n=1 Tax=Dyella soli TaxID=522319 RepID=A0A4R0YNG9_9GAMM|nr:hypothetical protein [Dyella soli]TCI07369.1 hypothetical protein EZM97_32825 [Dyella soli]
MRVASEGHAPLTPVRRGRLMLGTVKPFTGSPTHMLDIGASGTGVFAPAAPTTLVPGGGPVLQRPTIMPIFWGAEWTSPSPPIAPATLLDRLKTIIDGSYLDGLVQYGFTGKPTLLGPRYVTNTEPAASTTVAGWSTEGVNLLRGLIDAEQIAEPDEDWSRLTVIFLPSTVAYPSDSTGTTFGFHSSFQWVDYDLLDVDDDPVRFAMIGTAPFGAIPGIDMATYSFSHELVEAMTDPDGASGWRQSPGTGSASADEIADSPCNQIGRLDGTAVASYWSDADNACIIPSLTRTAFFEVSDRHLDAEVDGPEQSFHVERDCGRNHHWSGDYTYHIAQRHLTVTLQGKPRNWINPTGDWIVAGQKITTAAQPVSVNLPVSFPGYPDAVTANRLVTLTATATNDTLVLVNDPADGSYSVPVVFEVTETFNDGNAQAHKETWTLDVDIDGQEIVYSQAYIDALSRCMQQQLSTMTRDMKGLREVYAEFAELLRTHRGPPIDQDPIAGLARAAERGLRELRDLAKDVRRSRVILGRDSG